MNKTFKYLLIITALLLITINVDAQCSMCKAVVESGIDNSQSVEIGKGINQGIYFLMAIPYLLLSILAYTFYKNRRVTEV
ncbi:MAG: hypothetical protein HKN39_02125 [Flavobacteriales bacterium]|nr:hypothetical protein [Flavobacteriales bacterium]